MRDIKMIINSLFSYSREGGLSSVITRLDRVIQKSEEWIPAFAGMTKVTFGMTIIILFSFTSQAQAICADPEGIAGDQVYNGTHNVMQYCNGGNWVSMKSNVYTQWLQNGEDIYFSSGNVGIGTSTPATALHVAGVLTAGNAIRLSSTVPNENCAAINTGDIRYNATKASIEVCDGAAWKSSSAGDFTPGSIPFARADGMLIEDNNNLFWDATNNILRVSEVEIKTRALFDGAEGDAPLGIEQFADTLNLDDLDDVATASVNVDDVLTYNGSNWINKAVTLSLDNLSDVTVTNPVANNTLFYNGTGWENQPLTLDSLVNVAAPTPAANHALMFDGTNWVNQNLTLDALSNVVVPAPASNDALMYNGTNWVNQSLTMDSLVNVVAPTPVANDIMLFDGTNWVNQAIPTSVKTRSMVPTWPDVIVCNSTNPNYGNMMMYIENSPYIDGRYLYRWDDSAHTWGVWFNADKTFNSYHAGGFVTTSCGGKTITQLYAEGKAFDLVGGDGTYSMYELADTTIEGLAANDVLTYNGDDEAWVNKPFNLDTLSDVVVAAPVLNQSLVYNGANWVNQDAVTAMAKLTDVTLTTPAANDNLVYDGTKWVNIHTSSKTRSMVPTWPDAIVCKHPASWGDFTLFASHLPHTDGRYYYKFIEANANFYIIYNADRSYYSAIGSYALESDCVSKSITQLYATGRAFDLVGGDGNYTMYELADTTIAGLAEGDVLTFTGGAWKNKQQWLLNGTNVYYNGGNVGIGTNAPSYKLHVDGGSAAAIYGTSTSNYGVSGNSSSNAGVYGFSNTGYGGSFFSNSTGLYTTASNPSGYALITGTGNVGIGISAPTYKLHVDGGAATAIYGVAVNGRGVDAHSTNGIGVFGQSSVAQGVFGQSDSSYGGYFTSNTGTGLYATSTSGPAIVTGTGNVGIGTATPVSKLDVRGHLVLDAGISPVIYTGTSASLMNRYLQLINSPVPSYDSASGLKAGGILVADTYSYANPGKNDLIVKGNVGIGTTAPTQKLHVVGGSVSADSAILGQSDTGGVGVRGRSNSYIGVYGGSGSSWGVYGESANDSGTVGYSINGYGGYFTSANGGGILVKSCAGCSVISEMVKVDEVPRNGDIMCVNRKTGKTEPCAEDKSTRIKGVAQKYAEQVLRSGCSLTEEKDKSKASNSIELGVINVDFVLKKPECKGWYPIALSGLSEQTNVVCKTPSGRRLEFGDTLVSSSNAGYLRPIDDDESLRPNQIVGMAETICAEGKETDSIHVWLD